MENGPSLPARRRCWRRGWGRVSQSTARSFLRTASTKSQSRCKRGSHRMLRNSTDADLPPRRRWEHWKQPASELGSLLVVAALALLRPCSTNSLRNNHSYQRSASTKYQRRYSSR